MRRSPYLAFCVSYVLLFVVAFSSFGNFGILTRQRVQVFPFFLVLLAVPLAAKVSAPARDARLRGRREPTPSVDQAGDESAAPALRPIGPLPARYAPLGTTPHPRTHDLEVPRP